LEPARAKDGRSIIDTVGGLHRSTAAADITPGGAMSSTRTAATTSPTEQEAMTDQTVPDAGTDVGTDSGTDSGTDAARPLPLPDLRLAAVAGAVVLALWPGQVPHGAGVTAVTGGILGAASWGAASVVVRCVRAMRERDEDEAAARCRSRARITLTVLAWVTVVGGAAEGIVLAHGADVRLAHSLRAAVPSIADHLVGAAGAAAVCAVLVNLPRALQALARAVTRARASRVAAA
jgi:hypothetical protein